MKSIWTKDYKVDNEATPEQNKVAETIIIGGGIYGCHGNFIT